MAKFSRQINAFKIIVRSPKNQNNIQGTFILEKAGLVLDQCTKLHY